MLSQQNVQGVCMHLRSIAKVSSILSRTVSTMSELNLDKCLEAAIEVAKQAGKVRNCFDELHDP